MLQVLRLVLMTAACVVYLNDWPRAWGKQEIRDRDEEGNDRPKREQEG
jgi:hypothetical protein